jgi:hypothetical protein
MPLDAFFAAAGAFMFGAADAKDLTARLGPSPSGSKRLALYPELVRRQRRGILDGLFPAVHAACDLAQSHLWDELARDYTRFYPPQHWEPNHFGDALSDFLAARREAGAALPPYLEEIADYEYVRFAAGICDVPDGDDLALERGTFVRLYDHDVLSFVEQVGRSAPRPAPAPPAKAPTPVLVGWSITQHRVLTLRPSGAALAAIARRAGRTIPGGIDSRAVDGAERHLISIGILSSGSPS